MRYEQVREKFMASPFEPLLVRMVSGYEYRVRTPESLVSPRYATFLLPDGTHATLAIEFIEEIRPLRHRRSGRARNGQRRR